VFAAEANELFLTVGSFVKPIFTEMKIKALFVKTLQAKFLPDWRFNSSGNGFWKLDRRVPINCYNLLYKS